MQYHFKPELTGRVHINPEESGRLEQMIALRDSRYKDLQMPAKEAHEYIEQVNAYMLEVIRSVLPSDRSTRIRIEFHRSVQNPAVFVADCFDPVPAERFLIIIQEQE